VGPRAGPDVSANAKLLLPPGIEHRTVQPVAWTLHCQRHPGSQAFNNPQKQGFPKRLLRGKLRERGNGYTTKVERSGVDAKGRRTEIP